MDHQTRENAILKLDAMQQSIAYPDELFDKTTVDQFFKGISLKINANAFELDQFIIRRD